MGEKICWMNALELADAIKNRVLSPVEVVDAFLERIREVNPQLNAVVTVFEKTARREAEKAEREVKEGKKLGSLHGVPVALKDNIPTRGGRTTYGSKLYENHVPREDHVVVDRLRKAGAIIIGKTNLPEFALLPITDNLVFGSTRNPWDLNRTSGGSSGGSAAAVAAGMCPVAVGNDWGGSIRIPSSFCGVFGLKPQFGRVPRYPTLRLCEVTAVEGPITRTVADAALMMDVMAGPDSRDPYSLPHCGERYLENLEGSLNRGGFAYSTGFVPVDPEVARVVEGAINRFASAGYRVEEVELQLPSDVASDWVKITFSDLAAWSRFDEWKKVAYPPLKKLDIVANMRSVDYAKALRRRREIWDLVRGLFEKYDFLLTPTTPIPPFRTDPEGNLQWELMSACALFTAPFSLTGQPAASIPCGFTSQGLPVGLQVVGDRFDELGVLRVAYTFEKLSPWNGFKPPL